MKPDILGHLSVLDLARAATSCREFRNAYRHRLAAERQELRDAAQKLYGTDLINTFVRLVRQCMCDPARCSDLGDRGSTLGFIDLEGQLHTCDTRKQLRSSRPSAWVEAPAPDGASIFSPALVGFKRIFIGVMRTRKKLGGALILNKFPSDGVRVSVVAAVNKAAAPALLGLLLAICTGNQQAMPAAWLSPVTVRVVVTGNTAGPSGEQEAKCLIAPLRHLAGSVTVNTPAGIRPAGCVRDANLEYPLGHLEVTVD